MSIKPKELSVLIPSYNRPNLLDSLLSKVTKMEFGEILVSDDDSSDPEVARVLNRYSNFIRVYKQKNRLGLWMNHYFLLKQSAFNWIKFIQNDDSIDPKLFSLFYEYANDSTAIISALPVYSDLDKNVNFIELTVSKPIIWSSNKYLERLKFVGNELGPPSCTLLNKKFIPQDERYWQNELSVDYLINVLISSKANVVILPPGPIIIGIHSKQDGRTQTHKLLMNRFWNTIKIMKEFENNKVREIASCFSFYEGLGMLIKFINDFFKYHKFSKYYLFAWFHSLKYVSPKDSIDIIYYFVKAFRLKYGKRELLNISKL